MKKIDFRKIEAKDIEGNIVLVNISKEFGNYIFNMTNDIGEHETGKEIYWKGEIEVDAHKAEYLRKYIDATSGAIVKAAVFPLLDEIINAKKKGHNAHRRNKHR